MRLSPVSKPPRGRVDAPQGVPATGYGYPVLSYPATVPSQIPRRALVSHSETISAPSQYETLERGLEAVYGPYSTSAPLHTTEHEQEDQMHEAQRARVVLTALSSGPPGVAILTVITRSKSQRRCAITQAKEIGCYRQRGRGRGCDPTNPHEGVTALGLVPAFPQEINTVELSTNPSPALSALALEPPFYK